MEHALPREAPLDDFTLECRLRCADGEYRWMIVRSTPYRDQAGQVVKWMGDLHRRP